jgi:hypothetical protein
MNEELNDKFITTNNSEELHELINYFEKNGKQAQGYMWKNTFFPYYLSVSKDNKYVGWSDSSDRNVDYLSFKEFKNLIKQ